MSTSENRKHHGGTCAKLLDTNSHIVFFLTQVCMAYSVCEIEATCGYLGKGVKQLKSECATTAQLKPHKSHCKVPQLDSFHRALAHVVSLLPRAFRGAKVLERSQKSFSVFTVHPSLALSEKLMVSVSLTECVLGAVVVNPESLGSSFCQKAADGKLCILSELNFTTCVASAAAMLFPRRSTPTPLVHPQKLITREGGVTEKLRHISMSSFTLAK
mmetsp:Transcript_3620/g.8588  ORF Transcript_3620/g.8588 Transcript_3620/m.8588 type:complete len:215 (-) Transcript_3620:1480-2124(-)